MTLDTFNNIKDGQELFYTQYNFICFGLKPIATIEYYLKDRKDEFIIIDYGGTGELIHYSFFHLTIKEAIEAQEKEIELLFGKNII